MTPTATQEEDLVILSDNVTPTFDQTPIITENMNQSSSPLISFDTNDLITTAEPTTSSETTLNTNSNELNLDSQVGFLFGNSSVKEEPKVEQLQPEVTQDNLFGDFGLSNKNSEILTDLPKEEASLSSDSPILTDALTSFALPEQLDSNPSVQFSSGQEQTEEVGDMNSILDSTIAKLQKRQSGIASTKSVKIKSITDLESQIKDLREQVSTLKKDVESLDVENMKIDINISSLEAMKLGQNIKVPTKPREHNIKRVAKAE